MDDTPKVEASFTLASLLTFRELLSQVTVSADRPDLVAVATQLATARAELDAAIAAAGPTEEAPTK